MKTSYKFCTIHSSFRVITIASQTEKFQQGDRKKDMENHMAKWSFKCLAVNVLK